MLIPAHLVTKVWVKIGTKIRLKNIGIIENKKSGDLYLHIKVKD